MKLWSYLAMVVCSVFLLFLSACNHQTPPGDYDASEVGKLKKVVPGTIVSMRAIRLHNKAAEAGMVSPTAKSDTAWLDTGVNQSRGYEYVIRLNSGSIISVVQVENIKLKTKQHVLVIYGRNTRVVPDNGSDVF